MTEFPVLALLNALWVMGLADARVRLSLAESNVTGANARTARLIAAVVFGILTALVLAYLVPESADTSDRAARLRMFYVKLGAIGSAIVGLDLLMRHVLAVSETLAGRQTLVNSLLGFSLLFVYPIQENLRLGIDLAGGTQLIYQVRFDEETVPKQRIETAERGAAGLITRLKPEANPDAPARRVEVEDRLAALARAMIDTVVTADVADTLAAKAAEMASAVKAGEVSRGGRAEAVAQWLAAAQEAATAGAGPEARRTAKELGELAERLARMQDTIADRQRAIDDLIATLQRRVDPAAVLGLVWSYEGDRLTIQMPAPKREIELLRRAWSARREALEAGNIDVAALLQTLRQAAQEVGDGQAAAKARLEALRARHKAAPARLAAIEAVITTGEALLRADTRQTALPAEAPEADKAAATAARREALTKFEAAVAVLERGNIPVAVLEEALRLPRGRDNQGTEIDYAATVGAQTPPTDSKIIGDARYRALVRLRGGQRETELAEAIAAFDRYRGAVKSPVEDVEDLKRELRGAGVLSFHILPEGRELSPAARMAARRQLEETGLLKPFRTDDPATENLGDFRWFLADDPEWQRVDPETGQPYNDIFPPVGAPPLRGHRYILAWDADQYDATGRRTRRMGLRPASDEPWKLTRVMSNSDENGAPAVSFNLDENGGDLFAEMTRQNVRRMMMIVVDERAVTAATIRSVIRSSGQISGKFTRDEVDRLVRKLSAGSLRARLSDQPISEQTVGSTLGADNQRKGLNASLWSLLAVGVFMAVYYRSGGLVAVLALVSNLVMTLGAMVLLNASMTLPAIAGLVLTLGMSVDANVLIFERLREEREDGVPLLTALRNGYARAWSAITDSNVTTILAGVILAWVGTADIRGFGITLALGVSLSMFTALYATRTLLEILITRGWLTDMTLLSLVGTPRIDWMRLVPIFLTVSALANLWATDTFFGVPNWVMLVLLPVAAGIVIVNRRRDLFATRPLMISLGLAALATVPPVLAGWGLLANAEETDRAVRLAEAWNRSILVFGAIASLAALALIGRALSAPPAGLAARIPGAQAPLAGLLGWQQASFVGIVLSGLMLLAGMVRVGVCGAPPENFDIEFSTGTSVQLAFKVGREPPIEDVRQAIGQLGPALRAATVEPTTAADRWSVRFGGELAGRPVASAVFDTERFPDAAAVSAYVRGAAAEKLAGAAVQEIRVVEEVMDPQTGQSETVNRPRYQVKTLEDNITLVDGVMRGLFGEALDVQDRVRLGGPIQVSPVPAAGEALGLLGNSANAPYYHTFSGGVRLVLNDLSPPQTLDDIRKRIGREINRGGDGASAGQTSGGERLDNVVTNFEVVGLKQGPTPETFSAVEILGRGPADTMRLPADAKPSSETYRRWDRSVAGPFANLVEGALSRGQAFDRIVNFNPQIAAQATRAALSAVFLSWLGIILYLWFRFGEARWGLAGVICLIHDVCISLGLLLLGRYIAGTVVGNALLIDPFKIDLTVVAAVLTIIGYSVNNTIVVFDRIREVRGRSVNLSRRLINDSINQTMSRTILTTFLVFLSVVVLYVFGGAGIHAFSFTMLAGVLVGLYSSIAIAAPILLLGGAETTDNFETDDDTSAVAVNLAKPPAGA